MKKALPGLFFGFCFLLAVWPIFSASYLLNFDDNTHIFQNLQVMGGSLRSALNIFFSLDIINGIYTPLTALTFLCENVFFGLHPFISHGINILLHGCVCFLAFRLAVHLGLARGAAYFSALLFAVHPMHVEPVAWVTSRKDLLYSFFYLLSMISYWLYLQEGKFRNYVFALMAAGLSILSKPMALSLPVVLFLLDYMKQRPLSWRMFLDKVPFFMVVEPIALITYMMNSRHVPIIWPEAFLFWTWCITFYIRKFCWPFGLSVVYLPPFDMMFSSFQCWRTFMVLALSGIFVWIGRMHRIILFSAGFYILSIFFIWRYDIYDLNFVADRFMYLPMLGFCFVAGILCHKACRSGVLARVFLVSFFLFLSILFHQRATDWKDPFSLWNAAATVQPGPFSLSALGTALASDEFFPLSKIPFEKYVAKRAGASVQRMKNVYGDSFDRKIHAARLVKALKSYSRAIREYPNDLNSFPNKGIVFMALKQYEKALECFNAGVKLSRSLSSEAFLNRGIAYAKIRQYDLAMKDFDKAIKINPLYYQCYLNRSKLWIQKKEPLSALKDALMTVKIAPTYAPGYDMALWLAQAFHNKELEDQLLMVRKAFLR